MSTQVDIPGYVAGTWVIDTSRSEVSFNVRHFGFVKVTGTFDEFEGTIVTAESPLDSSVTAAIGAASVNTGSKGRDNHLRKKDFLHVEQDPTMAFSSTQLRVDGGGFLLDGDLTIRSVTKQVTLNLELDGFGTGPDGRPRVRFSAATEIDRADYGVTGGLSGAVINKQITINLRIEADKQD